MRGRLGQEDAKGEQGASKIPVDSQNAMQAELKIREAALNEQALRDAQVELAWHKNLSDLLMEELVKTRAQAQAFRVQVADMKTTGERAVQDECLNWHRVTATLQVRLSL